MDNRAVPHYIHRPNRDGSFDSICHACFATVASVRNEGELAQHERTHVCNPFWSHLTSDYSGPGTARKTPNQIRVFFELVLCWWDTRVGVHNFRAG